MPGVVDADTHIAEPEQMWELIDRDMYHRRPVVARIPDDTLYGQTDALWVIDGNLFPKPAGKGGFLLVTPPNQTRNQAMEDLHARDLTDISQRLRDMDELGTAVQVVYPTLFLIYVTDDVHLEVALCRAYNRFLARAWAQAGGRLRWVVVPPLRNIAATIDELRFAKAHGAVGVFFRGIERDRTLDDPYFFPVYEEASALDLPICVHTGAGCPDWTRVIDVSRSFTFPHVRLPPLVAFRNIVANNIPAQFPGLRFGFIETGASWVPYVLHSLRGTEGGGPERWGPRLFEENRIFVAYEEQEDLPYLLKYIGEDHVVMGSDYGHHGVRGVRGDPSAQLHMVRHMRAREDVPTRVVEKILCENPRQLYGLD
jgi:predicted TIM-barrel fold metal-dependent hydrolase